MVDPQDGGLEREMKIKIFLGAILTIATLISFNALILTIATLISIDALMSAVHKADHGVRPAAVNGASIGN